MAKNYFNRYVWLIDTINRHGHITRADLSRLWEHSPLNETGEELYERTFHNHREAILDTFGIEIKCDRSLGYYIANSDDLEGEDGVRQWLLESLSLNNMLNESADMRDRILFEKIPSSQKWLAPIVNAMRDGKAIKLTYQSFIRSEPKTLLAHPYCLKLFRQRWYMLALSEGYEEPRIYALDRVYGVEESDQKLEVSEGFNAQEFFSNYFGIIVGTDCKPSTVELRVTNDQVKYFESLPLHSSQEKIDSDEDYTIFQYHLVPTFDFKQEILSRGPKVKVLMPEWFRNEVASDIKKMAGFYD